MVIVFLFGMLSVYNYEAPEESITTDGLCHYDLDLSNSIKVLFIGNSHTRFNDMPKMMQCIAASQGKSIEFEMVVRDGEQIKGHWENGVAFDKIHSRYWDFVVLQEKSSWAVEPEIKKDFYDITPLFISEIKKIGAKPVFFGTYARKPKSIFYGRFLELKNYDHMHEITSYEYSLAANKFGAKVVPVAKYWDKVLKKNEPKLLYSNDGNHPSMYGSYLTALVFSKYLAKVDLDAGVWMPKTLEEEKVQKLLESL